MIDVAIVDLRDAALAETIHEHDYFEKNCVTKLAAQDVRSHQKPDHIALR